MTARMGDGWVRPSPCCRVDLEVDVGHNDSGVVGSVLRCTSCCEEYPLAGERMTPVEVRTRVAQALNRMGGGDAA